ncbi:MAG: UbiA family prenyltransferase [Candidatus Bathyarchaeia archaeon]
MRTVKELARRLACEGFISALVCPSAVFLSSTVLRLPLSWDYLLITYLGTHAVLLYNRYEEIERDLLTNPTRSEYIKRHFRVLPIIIALLFLLALLIPLLQGRILGASYALLLLFLGLMYPKFFKKHVRLIAFKDAYAAFLLSSVVILAPVYYSYPITPAFLLLFLFIFLRFFVNTSFFDVKDVESDRREGILTLSAALGIEKTVKVLWIMKMSFTFQ